MEAATRRWRAESYRWRECQSGTACVAHGAGSRRGIGLAEEGLADSRIWRTARGLFAALEALIPKE